MKYASLAILLACPVGHVAAQSPLSGLQHGFIVQSPGNPGVRQPMRKPAGDRQLVPFVAIGSASPTYTIEALLHGISGDLQVEVPQFAINAMSTGNDNLPIQPGFYPGNVGPNPDYWEVVPEIGLGWAAIALSVKEGPVSAVADSVFAQRLAAAGSSGIGNDLFSYWFKGNAQIHPSLNDAAFFDLGREHMALASGMQITALDTYMPGVVEARGQATDFMPVLNRWFFTLTPDAVTHITTNWSVYEPVFDAVSSEIGANFVYQTTWGSGGWSNISVLFDPAELGLGETDVIDAIGYFDRPNSREHLLFSLEGTASPDQLLVGGPDVRATGLAGQWPLRAQGGDRITERVGIGNNTDVDAFCTYDPEHATDGHCVWSAMPTADATPFGFGSSAARYRSYDASGAYVWDSLLLQATGLGNQVGMVTWLVSVEGMAQPLIVRKLNTGDRTETELRMPFGLPAMTVKTVFTTSTTFQQSWHLFLDSPL